MTLNFILQHPQLTAMEKNILLAFSLRCEGYTEPVAISMKEISQAVSCSPKTVSKAVQKLFFLRIIDKISKPPEVNRYFLLK